MGIGAGGRQKVSVRHFPENVGQSTAIFNLCKAFEIAASSSEMVATEFEDGPVLPLNQHNWSLIGRLARILRSGQERCSWLDYQTVVTHRHNCGWSPTAVHSFQTEQGRAFLVGLNGHYNPRSLGINDRLSIQESGIGSLLSARSCSSGFYRLPGDDTPRQTGDDNQPPVWPFDGCVPLWRVGAGSGLIRSAAGFFDYGVRSDNGEICILAYLTFLIGSFLWLTGHRWGNSQQHSEYRQMFQHDSENVSQISLDVAEESVRL
jgi:hypothetical protein